MVNHSGSFTFLIVVLSLVACSGETLQEGIASWYGPGFHGQRTSSGEIYNEQDTTAAHRTLPFDTIVRVVNTENGESVEVRINDRGPYTDNRIIDLSRGAAEELDMMESGIAHVRLELVEAGGTIPRNLDQELYTIQLGEYNSPHFAEKFLEEIGGEARLEQVFMFGRTRYIVYYGHYQSMSNARAELTRLEEKGFDGLVKQIN